MSLILSFTPEAREELFETILYYESESPGLGAAFLASVEQGLDQLLEFSESAPILQGTVRRKVLRRFPYSLLYSVSKQRLRVLAIMNQKRKPGYWRGRK